MNRTINVEAFTYTGGREENQDNFMLDRAILCMEEDGVKNCEIERDEQFHAVVVCDGIGGASAGDLAAIETLDEVFKCLEESKTKDLMSFTKEILDRVNERIVNLAGKYFGDMGTTISMVVWKEKDYYIANIGDSPIFILRDGRMKKVSFPHTAATLKKSRGEVITPSDYHRLINYVGRKGLKGSEMAHITKGRFEEDDKILLCSDGLTEVIEEKRIERCLQANSNSFGLLLREVSSAVLRDNCTAVVIDLKPLKTVIFNDKLGKCEDDEDYEEIIRNNQEEFQTWKQYITEKVEQYRKAYGVAKGDIAKYCGVDKKTVRSCLREIPKKRESVIMLGVLLGMDIDAINFMLANKARYHELYPKNAEDVVWMYLIEHKVWTKERRIPIMEVFEQYFQRFQCLQSNIMPKERKSLKTQYLKSEIILNADFDDAMMKVIPGMTKGYQQLIAYINKALKRSELSIATLEYVGIGNSQRQKYYRALDGLRHEYIVPSRGFLMALGIHLGLEIEEIDHMLQLAGMRPVYSKEHAESRLRYYLELYQAERPDLFTKNDDKLTDVQMKRAGTDSLPECIYRKMKKDKYKYKEYPVWEEIMELL